MTPAIRKQDQILGDTTTNVGRQSTQDHAGALRGPTPIRVGRTFWLVMSAIIAVVVAAALVVAIVAATTDNARITRMKDHGIPVTITVASCIGNLSGSGTNIASYSCVGDYNVRGSKYQQLVAGMTTYYAPGTKVQGVVDPAKHSTVELSSALRASSASAKAYLTSGILLFVLIVLALGFVMVARRRKSSIGSM
jgi:hypothetical protein